MVQLTIEVTAVLHHLSPTATVIGIDHLPGLVDLAKENLKKDGIELGSDGGIVKVVLGDGRIGQSLCTQPVLTLE